GLLPVDIVIPVADIHAAGHPPCRVHYDHLMMHTPPQIEIATLEQRPKPAEMDTRRFPLVDHLTRKMLRGVSVQKNEDGHFSLYGTQQGRRYQLPRLIRIENVRL